MKSILNISCENWDLKERVRVRVSGLGLGQNFIQKDFYKKIYEKFLNDIILISINFF